MTRTNSWLAGNKVKVISFFFFAQTSGTIYAATTTGTFTVTANILAACTVSANTLAFGNYNPSSATPLNQTSTINVYCTNGTPFSTSLNAGSGTGSTYTTRHMVSTTPAATLNYNLYTTSGLTTVWGDSTGGTGTVSGTGAGLLIAVPQTVYGSMPINQDQPVSTSGYTSTITATVTY